MATISITTGALQRVVELFFQEWESAKDQIKLQPRNLYNLIALKKQIEEHARTMQETIQTLAIQHGGTPTEMGGYSIPEEQREALNQKLNDFSNESVEINFSYINLTKDEFLPVNLMDAIFDFISIAD